MIPNYLLTLVVLKIIFIKTPHSERYVFIGYKWSNHVNNINYAHSNNLHLEIGDVSTVPYTLLKDIKSNIMDISQIVTINTNNITLIKSDITDFIASDMIEPDLTIENSYISNILNAGSIYVNPISNSAFSCKIYSITKNTVYKIKAINHQLSDSYPSAVFTTTYVSQPGIAYKLENYNVIHNSTATKENVDINFSSSIDGYIIIACVSHYTSQLEIYDTIQESKINNIKNRLDILDNILTTQDTLKDKNVAVLGDSIMMLQRTGFSGTNNVSYIGSDENIYTIEELTNINGKLYVTEDTSIICEIVNSKQSDLDNQNWVSLKNSLGAANLMNLGLGGGTVREKRIITEYPYPDGGSGTNCLSNEVKMLKRLVNSGKPIPDCILIWIGTNDASVAFGNDNNADRNFDFDTVMGMDYDVLADDTLGKGCRSSFYGGLRYSLETLCREFPHATIFIFTPFQTNLSNHRTYERLSTVGNALIKMGKRYSCICVDSLNEIGIVDLLETSLGDGPFLYDGLHPNPTGKRLLTNYATSRLTSLYFFKN